MRTILLILLAALLPACSGDARSMKNALLDAAAASKQQLIEVDLAKFSSKPIRKICVQTPYMPKELFEKESGEVPAGFDFTDDGEIVLWVFHDQGDPTQLTFHRFKEIGLHPDGPRGMCRPSSRVQIDKSMLRFVD